jgi:Arc/MetJ family transcription regulator
MRTALPASLGYHFWEVLRAHGAKVAGVDAGPAGGGSAARGSTAEQVRWRRLLWLRCMRALYITNKGAAVAITQIDLDDDALAEAMRLSGARSKKETVNLALREYAARHRRIAALDHYAAAARTWDYEGWQDMHTAGKAPAA